LVSVHTGATAGHRRTLEIHGDSLTMSVMGDTNVELRFAPPVDVDVHGQARDLVRVRCYVDDPRDVARRLRAGVLEPEG
jgi:hypothetical protein